MLAKEVCEQLNIDTPQLGGLVERPEPPQITQNRIVDLSKMPDEPPPINTLSSDDVRLPNSVNHDFPFCALGRQECRHYTQYR
jgi:hypothetical protein